MEEVKFFVKKELRYLLHRKEHLGFMVLFVLVFAVVSSLELKELGPLFLGPLVLFVTLWTFLILILKSEQANNTVSFLLASPFEFREVIIGKIAAAFLLAYSAELFSFGIGAGVFWFRTAQMLPLSASLQVLVVIPIWSWLIAGMLALSYVLFGSPLVAQVVGLGFMALFINLGSTGTVGFLNSHPVLFVLLGLTLIVLSYYLLGRFDREWVVKRWKHSAS
ncbi:hypothetical protein KGY72_07050 [Candidatus Bipolaricaulota bacterium]|nr:hypothetical protein [Candidatus Bipolaricaulota bacterium]